MRVSNYFHLVETRTHQWLEGKLTKHDGKRSYKNITTRNIELSRREQIESGADTLTTVERVN